MTQTTDTAIARALSATAIAGTLDAVKAYRTAEGDKTKAQLSTATEACAWGKANLASINDAEKVRQLSTDFANKVLEKAGETNNPNLRNLILSSSRRHAIFSKVFDAAKEHAKVSAARAAKGDKVNANERNVYHNLVRGLANDGVTQQAIAAAYKKGGKGQGRKARPGSNAKDAVDVASMKDASALAETLRTVINTATKHFAVPADMIDGINAMADKLAALPKKTIAQPKVETSKRGKSTVDTVEGAVSVDDVMATRMDKMETMLGNMAALLQGRAKRGNRK